MMLPDLDYKRILLAILLVIISIGLIYGVIWLIFLRTPGPGPDVGPDVIEPSGGLPVVGPGGDINIVGPGGALPISPDTGEGGEVAIEASQVAQGSFTQVESVIDEEIKEISLGSGGFSYLSGEDDKFYTVSLSGQNRLALSQEVFAHVDQVTWSPDNNKVILEYPDGANIFYDFTKNKKVTLPLGGEDFVFDSSSDNIAYKFMGGREEDNWLVASDANNTNAQAIEPIGDEGDKVQVSWSPNNQVVALFHKPIGLSREEVFFIGLNDENFKSLVVEGSNFTGIWSPSGNRLLYHIISPENDYNPLLWITDAQGDSIGNNNFNLGLSTWVDKCAFSLDNRYVYCAVPVDLPQGAGLYSDLLNQSADVFYQIDLSTGISKLIAYPILSEDLLEFQVKKLFISNDNSKLYFWDGFTEKVYYMRLK